MEVSHRLEGQISNKQLPTGHIQVRLSPQPSKRIRELTGKSYLASSGFFKNAFSWINAP